MDCSKSGSAGASFLIATFAATVGSASFSASAVFGSDVRTGQRTGGTRCQNDFIAGRAYVQPPCPHSTSNRPSITTARWHRRKELARCLVLTDKAMRPWDRITGANHSFVSTVSTFTLNQKPDSPWSSPADRQFPPKRDELRISNLSEILKVSSRRPRPPYSR